MPRKIWITYWMKLSRQLEPLCTSPKKCDLEGQYQLGTEAALRPHLRTLIIIRQGKLWCTSLPGNRILLKQIPVITDTNLLLTPARNTENEIPVLLYQTRFQTNHIIVTISGVHIRGALNVPLKGGHIHYS